MRRAKCFGINLARLDIRQESARHKQLISEFIKSKYKKDYSNFTEKEKIIFLKKSITSKSKKIRNFKFKNKENKEVWATFNTLSKEPPECLGAYVISMTTSASDILSVSFLQKEANIKSKLRVVPLFETLDDLVNARSIMETLLSQKW
jgi:phosphoenolpyruvate carboxylase